MNLSFKVFNHPDKAKEFWEIFSPHQHLDDDWNFRFCFIKNLNLKLNFVVGFDNDVPIGLLPLQQNPNFGISQKIHQAAEPFLEFFGGVDTDSNIIFLKAGYEKVEVEFLKQIKTKAILSDLEKPVISSSTQSVHYNDKYILNLTKFKSFDDFLQTNFDGKSRQRLKNRINKLQRNYKVDLHLGTKKDLSTMFDLSIKRFGNDSSFNMSYRQKIFEDLYDDYETDFFIIKLNNIIKAASFALKYKDTYTSINNGYDTEVRDLAKFLAVTQIQRAFEQGFKIYDGGKGDNGWKEHFHLTKIPQYKLVLN